MQKTISQESKLCVYCPEKALTKDHLPPRNLFHSKPSDLITVPCCQRCNQEFSLDDEYFRLTLALRFDTDDHREIPGITEKVMNSLKRPQARGLMHSLFNSLTRVEVKTRAGLYLGTLPGYVVKLPRLERVARRIVKGLFYYEFGERLPETHDAFARIESSLANAPEDIKELFRERCSTLQATPPKTRGEDVFSYWVQRVDDDPYTSFWVLLFYKRVGFLGFTAPKDFQRHALTGQ